MKPQSDRREGRGRRRRRRRRKKGRRNEALRSSGRHSPHVYLWKKKTVFVIFLLLLLALLGEVEQEIFPPVKPPPAGLISLLASSRIWVIRWFRIWLRGPCPPVPGRRRAHPDDDLTYNPENRGARGIETTELVHTTSVRNNGAHESMEERT